MSHVDEGLIHAYLDGAFPPGNQQGEEIEAHMALCVDCRVRLDKARELKERAQVVMHRLAPNTIATPPFQELLVRRDRARAAAGNKPDRDAAPQPRARNRPSAIFPIPFAWAATVVLAVGAGWMGRELVMNQRMAGADADAAALESSMVDAPLSQGSAAAPAEAATTGDAAGTNAGSLRGETRSERADRAAVEQETLQRARASTDFVPPPAALKTAQPQPQRTAADQRRQVAQVPERAEIRMAPMLVPRDTSGALVLDLRAPDTTRANSAVLLLAAYMQATLQSSWNEDAAAGFGLIGYGPLARIEGRNPVRAERAVVESVELLRTAYVIDGDTVELTQQLLPMALALDEVIVTGQRADSVAGRRPPVAAAPPPAANLMAEAGVATPAIQRVTLVGDTGSVFEAMNVVTVRHDDRVIVLTSRMPFPALQAVATRIR